MDITMNNTATVDNVVSYHHPEEEGGDGSPGSGIIAGEVSYLGDHEPPEISPGRMWDGDWQGVTNSFRSPNEETGSLSASITLRVSCGDVLNDAEGAEGSIGTRLTSRHPTREDIKKLLPHEGGKVTSEWRPRITKEGLGTIMGVFVPSLLSIIGVVLFLRLGWAVGQAGMMCTILMFAIGGLMGYLTILSVSALATNGRVGGGGAYYLLSRSIGPELGGAIGMVFAAANICGIAFYTQGFTDTLKIRVGDYTDAFDNHWVQASSGIGLLLMEALICIFSPSLYSRCILLLLMAQISAQIFGNLGLLANSARTWEGQTSSVDSSLNNMTFVFTGPSWDTFTSNLWPDFDENGSFSIVFGIVFPAMTGIMAGANMSGVLKRPDLAIPRGSLAALTVALVGYVFMIFSLGASVERDTLKNDYLILARVTWLSDFVIVGVIISSASSALASIQSAARLLQAVASDDLIPIISPFKRMWRGEPALAIAVATFVASLLLLVGSFDVLAPLLTMFTLITYATTNVATFLYTVAGAPNFRPRFRLFSWGTALFGGLMCITLMLYIQWSATLIATAVIIILTWYIGRAMDASGRDWGDVTQALIFHQVRKYLLRLVQDEHIKFWRARFLMLVTSPQSKVQTFEFMNDMKKGGLLIIGDPVVDPRHDGTAQPGSLLQLAYRKTKWREFIQEAKLKAFVNCAHAGSYRSAAKSLLLMSGLGGMTPNCLVTELTPSSASAEDSHDDHEAGAVGEQATPKGKQQQQQQQRRRPKEENVFGDGDVSSSSGEAAHFSKLHSFGDAFSKMNSVTDLKAPTKRRFVDTAAQWHRTVPFESSAPPSGFDTAVLGAHDPLELPVHRPASPSGYHKPAMSDREHVEIMGDAEELKMSLLMLANFSDMDIPSVIEKHELHKALLSTKADKRFSMKLRIDVWECPWGAPEDFNLAVQLADMLMRQDTWEKHTYIRVCSFVEEDDDTLRSTKERYASLHGRVIRKMRVPATIQVWGLGPSVWNEALRMEAAELAVRNAACDAAAVAAGLGVAGTGLEYPVPVQERQTPVARCVSPLGEVLPGVAGAAAAASAHQEGAMNTLLTHLPSSKRLAILHDLVKQRNDNTAVTFMSMPGMPPRDQAPALAHEYMERLRKLTEGLGPVVLVWASSEVMTYEL